MVEYLDGGRIQGSSTKTSAPPQTSWKELARASLSSAGDTITTSTFTAKDNIMILAKTISDGQVTANYRFNADSGSNYARRQSSNGGSDGTGTSQNVILAGYGTSGETTFITTNVINEATKEKLVITELVTNGSGNGAGNAPNRREIVGKWANTSDAITSVTLFNNDTGSFAAGSEIVVLGCDNDEADSGTNFWQELASTTLTSTSYEINSGTFTAKKYLMVELQVIADGSISGSDLQFNGDTGSNYARRYRTGGDSEATGTSEATLGGGTGGDRGYNTWFIVNVADKEKLALGEATWTTNGAGNAPSRRELTGKWANTSAQITSIKVKENASGGWASGSTLKVWGAD